MSEGLALPIAALDFMNDDAPDASSLSTLQGFSPTAMEALVVALEHRELLDHLELLAEFGATSKDVRKSAGAAAYRLRSRGIKPRKRATVARIEAKAEPVDLGFVALVSPPGLIGRFWMLLGSIPGSEALEVKGDADGGVEGIEVVRPVSGSKLEKLAREFERKSVRGLPVRASADLAVRLLRSWAASIPPERVPPMWHEVETWRKAATTLGADPNRAAARMNIADSERPMPFKDLYKLEAGGIHLPTPAVLQRVLSGMREMLDKPAIEASRVEERAADLTREALGSWLSVADVRARLSRWLEATADVLFALKQPSAAAGFLALADTLGPAEDGYKLVEHPFFRQLEVELLGSELRAAASPSSP